MSSIKPVGAIPHGCPISGEPQEYTLLELGLQSQSLMRWDIIYGTKVPAPKRWWFFVVSTGGNKKNFALLCWNRCVL